MAFNMIQAAYAIVKARNSKLEIAFFGTTKLTIRCMKSRFVQAIAKPFFPLEKRVKRHVPVLGTPRLWEHRWYTETQLHIVLLWVSCSNTQIPSIDFGPEIPCIKYTMHCVV